MPLSRLERLAIKGLISLIPLSAAVSLGGMGLAYYNHVLQERGVLNEKLENPTPYIFWGLTSCLASSLTASAIIPHYRRNLTYPSKQ